MSSQDDTTTAFEDKCVILGDVWINYKLDEEFSDFVSYNDLGLPLAFAISEGIVDTTEIATKFINETFDLLLSALGVDDAGYTSLDEMFTNSEK